MVDSWLVVGLGNPGLAFSGTRHSVGYMVVDALAVRLKAVWSVDKRHHAHVAHGRFNDAGQEKIIIAKPMSAMNLSGAAVKALASYYRISHNKVVALHDDVDIPFDTVKLKAGGGEGGHNGLRSISKALGARDYCRVRIGIGRPPGRQDTADFVLKPFTVAEREVLPSLVSDGADAVEMLITQGLTKAQNEYH